MTHKENHQNVLTPFMFIFADYFVIPGLLVVKWTHASVMIGDNSSLACQPQRKGVKMSI